MTLRTDPSVRAMQHNARELSHQVLAAAGATQGNAAYIGAERVVIVTATASSQGVRLPPLAAGEVRRVVAMSNRGVKVYPHTGQRITGAATNAAVSVPLNRAYDFVSDGSVWRIDRGAAS